MASPELFLYIIAVLLAYYSQINYKTRIYIAKLHYLTYFCDTQAHDY